MIIDVKVPQLPESISEATLASWKKQEGNYVQRDENLIDLETDKIVLELPAPQTGILTTILVENGATVTSGTVIARIDTAAQARPAMSQNSESSSPEVNDRDLSLVMPSAARLATQLGINLSSVRGTGRDGRILKEDVLAASQHPPSQPPKEAVSDVLHEPEVPPSFSVPPVPETTTYFTQHIPSLPPSDLPPPDLPPPDPSMVQNLPLPSFEEPSLTAPPLQKEVFTAPEEISSLPQDIPASPPPLFTPLSAQSDSPPRERREPMSRMRQAIAGRMVLSQQTSALLTTFNEVNMQPLLDLRAKYKERFEKRHGIKLGIMSFFVKAVVHALKTYPVVNARIDETDIVYTDYYDIGVAVGSARGLVVPILRNADTLSLADIEKQISDFSLRAQDGRITLEEMSGGTYTITNGGVFGSMMSTPIVNPPQSAILGMHAITERAIVEDGKIVARPMMYLAQSYDHRLIDGREAVLSLVAIKDIIEDPVRLLLEI